MRVTEDWTTCHTSVAHEPRGSSISQFGRLILTDHMTRTCLQPSSCAHCSRLSLTLSLSLSLSLSLPPLAGGRHQSHIQISCRSAKSPSLTRLGQFCRCFPPHREICQLSRSQNRFQHRENDSTLHCEASISSKHPPAAAGSGRCAASAADVAKVAQV